MDYCIARNGRVCYLDNTASEIAKHCEKDSQQELATEIFDMSTEMFQKVCVYVAVRIDVFRVRPTA